MRCSGLRSLMSLLALGVALSVLSQEKVSRTGDIGFVNRIRLLF